MYLTCATWRKSSYSGNNGGQCVEVAAAPGRHAGRGRMIAVRDSKDPEGPVLAFGPGEWRVFTDQVKAGALGLG
ncbi:MAG TPA: DUF397 domain-containing protein [Streptosporangiaceae bacterium]